MAKFCSNGHQMEDSWTICPYCQRTGYQMGAGAGLAKTRLEGHAAAGHNVMAQPNRKTVLLREAKKAPLAGWLVAMSGEQKGEDFRIREGQTIIGSAADCDIVLQEPTVSAHHASLRCKDGVFTLSDLDSTNGTFLNDSEASIARESIKDNDVIRLGDVTLKFKEL